MSDQPLAVLIGRDISSVEFVRDYVQIRFDGPHLTAVSDPIIITESVKYNRRQSDFCNLLISCIGQSVIRASVIENEEIRIGLQGGMEIVISLRPEDHRADEAAMFDDHQGNLWVW